MISAVRLDIDEKIIYWTDRYGSCNKLSYDTIDIGILVDVAVVRVWVGGDVELTTLTRELEIVNPTSEGIAVIDKDTITFRDGHMDRGDVTVCAIGRGIMISNTVDGHMSRLRSLKLINIGEW